jgi:hypothetical protein
MLVQMMMEATGDGGVQDNNFSKFIIFPKLDVVVIIHFLIMEFKLLVETLNLVTFSFF